MAIPIPLHKTFAEAPYSWGYLFGAFLSDGSKPYYARHYWFAHIHATDKDFIERVRDYAADVTGYSYKIRYVPRRHWYQLRVTRRAFTEALQHEATPGSYTWGVPRWIMTGRLDAKRGFLNGFFDGDGWVTPVNKHHRPVFGFRSVNLRGLSQIQRLLQSLGIEGRIYQGVECHSLIIYRIQDARAYLGVVGITGERKLHLATTYLHAFEETKRDDYWKTEEHEYIRSYYGKMKVADIAIALKRSPSGIRAKAKELGVSTHPRWTKEQLQFLQAHQGDSPDQLAKALGRSAEAVRHMLQRHGLSKPRWWTQEMDAYLLSHWAEPMRPVAVYLGVTEQAARARKIRLKAKRPPPAS